MSDLIDRQEAINALSCINPTEPYIYYDEAVEAIKELPSAQQWTPCSEKLPKEEDMYKPPKHRYLCQLRRQDITPVLARLRNVGSPMAAFWDWYGKKVPDKEVIAWMPLPEPYREGEQDG